MKHSRHLLLLTFLVFFSVNQRTTASQKLINPQSQYNKMITEETLDLEFQKIENKSEKNYYFNPIIIIPVVKKSVRQKIVTDNLVAESGLDLNFLKVKIFKTIEQIIKEGKLITEARPLTHYNQLDFGKTNKNKNYLDTNRNRNSLKNEK